MIFIHNRLPSAVFLIFKIKVEVPVYVNVTIMYFRVTLSGSLMREFEWEFDEKEFDVF